MFQRIPSPAALRTFEAAARLGSFKAGAKELGVTPTAVSHQIRALEEALGTALFVRRTRAIELTEAGATLAPAVHAGFTQIKAAVEEIVAGQSIITVATTPAFAALRLVPRLLDFYAQHPEIVIQLDTGTKPVDLSRDRRIEVAIRYGVGPYGDLHAVPLLSESFGVYGAPGLLENLGDITEMVLLETAWQQPLLQEVTWTQWLGEAGLAIPESDLQITRFEEENFVLQAAIAGQGLVLASSALVGDMVARNLLSPYRHEIQLRGAQYTALCLPDRADTTKMRHFQNWLAGAFGESG